MRRVTPTRRVPVIHSSASGADRTREDRRTVNRMYLTSRDAAARIGEAHGLGPTRARQALVAGLAGPPLVVGRQRMFPVEAVDALASRQVWNGADARISFDDGVLVARVSPERGLDLTQPRATQVAAVSEGWRLGLLTRVAMSVSISAGHGYPFIATVAGFVAVGGQIMAMHVGEDGRTRLELADPGDWWETVASVRFRLRAGHEVVLCDEIFPMGINSRWRREAESTTQFSRGAGSRSPWWDTSER